MIGQCASRLVLKLLGSPSPPKLTTPRFDSSSWNPGVVAFCGKITAKGLYAEMMARASWRKQSSLGGVPAQDGLW